MSDVQLLDSHNKVQFVCQAGINDILSLLALPLDCGPSATHANRAYDPFERHFATSHIAQSMDADWPQPVAARAGSTMWHLKHPRLEEVGHCAQRIGESDARVIRR